MKVASRREQLQAALLAALCAVLFLGPALLPGRALVPYPPELHAVEGAHARAAGMADDELYRGTLCMGDKYGQSLAWDRILQDRLRKGEIPLWTNDIGGGASFVPQMAQVFQPWNALLLLLPSTQAYGIWFLLHQVLFGWLGYRFFRRIGCSHGAGLLGVAAAVLGLWVQCRVHHNVVLTAALSLWPMLSSIHAIHRGGGLRTIAGLALWTGLTWMSGFVVVSLQITYLCAGFALLQAIGNERGRRLAPLLQCGGGVALGLMLASAHMLPVAFASAESARPAMSLERFRAQALEWDHAATLLWPDLFAWAADWFHRGQAGLVRPPWTPLVAFSRPATSAGFNWVECSFAFGIVPLLGALVAFGDRSRRHLAVFFAGFALFGLMLATATPGVAELARLLPGLAATDAKRNVFLVAFAGIVVAVLGADRLLQERPRRVLVTLATLLLVSASGTIAFAGASGDDLVQWIARGIAWDRNQPEVAALGADPEKIAAWIRSSMWPDEALANLVHLRTTFARATIVCAVALLAFTCRGRTRLALLLAITIGELWHAGLGPVVAVASDRVTTPPDLVQSVLRTPAEAPGVRPRLHRLADPTTVDPSALYMPNLPGYHGLEDLATYNPLPPLRMEEFFLAIEPDADGKRSVTWSGSGIGYFRRDASLQHPLLDVLGVRFVLAAHAVNLPGLVDRTPPGTPPPHRLYERTTCLPRATFVRQVQVVADAADRRRELSRVDRDVIHQTILEDGNAPRPTGEGPAEAAVTIVQHADECVRIRVQTTRDGYLRLADPFDPGWIATVDGQPSPVYAADHYLRAVYVPAGEHEVVLAFAAPRVVWPLRLSLLALLTITGLWFVGVRRERRQLVSTTMP
ncbi:MAG: YfhO family protein [Planctomycetes bacterium]|nr:YfhO family protein [Planctomycetota bacterium]